MEIRNVAIVAHVDHGKTTLVDELLKESEKKDAHEVIAERVMDSGDLERERGITILAKNTAIEYKNVKINILDTPGHADFGGEVERIMKMVDAVCLVVDAFEGVMPQTKFVLNKALQEGLKPIVVINKIDRTFSRPKEVLDEVYELFMDLGATEDQLDFPILYASGIQGKASYTADLSKTTNMVPLLDTIIKHVKRPDGDPNGKFQFQPALFDYNEYVGRIGIGKIARGKVSQNQTVSVIRLDGKIEQFKSY
jgi:GTP-binding protein